VYLNKKPDTALPPIEREFVKFVLSRSGQEIVSKDGYIPLSNRIVARELRKLE
jgi:phosphate transport system substrate-binding protein